MTLYTDHPDTVSAPSSNPLSADYVPEPEVHGTGSLLTAPARDPREWVTVWPMEYREDFA